MTAALIGIAVFMGYVLPDMGQMLGIKTFDSADARRPRVEYVFGRDTNRNVDQRLTREQGVNVLADWSPDGQQIAYLSFTLRMCFLFCV